MKKSLTFFQEHSDSDEEELIRVFSDHGIDKNQRAYWQHIQWKKLISINGRKNTLQLIDEGQRRLTFIRENPDPQLHGEVSMTRQEYNNSLANPCIFCNQTQCLYFYFRETFYKHIDYCLLNFDSLFSKEKNALFQIENQNDIFLPGSNSTTENFDLVEIVQQNNFQNTDDWFSFNVVAQFKHEAKFRDYILKNNSKSVIVNGKEFQIPQNPFRINVNPQQLKQPCNVCKRANCVYKNYTGLLIGAVDIANKFFLPFQHNFDNHEALLVAENWTLSQGQAIRYTFSYGTIKIELSDNPFNSENDSKRNYLTFFIEHVKAYSEPFKQFTPNACQKKFCHYICRNLADKVCSQCKQVWYCSVQHQKSDWEFHKLNCKSNKVTTKQESQLKTKNSQILSSTQNKKSSNSTKSTKFEQEKQIKSQLETQKSELVDGQKNLQMQSTQFEQKAEKVDDWDDLKNKQNLLLSFQNQLTPTSDISSTNPPSDIQNVSVNPEKSILKNVVEECKEPQDTIQSKSQPKNQVSNQQAVSLKNSDSERSSSVNIIESPESKKDLPVVAVAQPISTDQKEDVLISQKTEISQCQINDLEERVTDLEVSKFQLQKENLKLNEKLLKLEQEHFELRQQVKQLMRKFN